MGSHEIDQCFTGESVNHAPSHGGDTPSRYQTPRERLRDLITWTAAANGSTYELVMSAGRSRPVVVARRACIVAVHRARPDLSYPALGRVFDRDHTTVMHHLWAAGVHVPGFRHQRNAEMKACEAVAKFARSLRHHLEL